MRERPLRPYYSGSVSGTHQREPDDGRPDGPRFGGTVLVAIVTVTVVVLATMAAVIFTTVSHLSTVQILVCVLDCVIVAQAGHRLVMNIRSGQPKSAEHVLNRLSLVAQLISSIAIAAISVGALRHRTLGLYSDILIGILAVYVLGAPIYWLGGKRRLIAAIKARTPGDTQQPGPA